MVEQPDHDKIDGDMRQDIWEQSVAQLEEAPEKKACKGCIGRPGEKDLAGNEVHGSKKQAGGDQPQQG